VPPGPSPAVRTAERGNCPECRPGESAVTIEAHTAAAGGNCETALAAARATAQAMQSTPNAIAGSEFGTYAGPDGGSCQVLAILLPRGARYLGYRYEAEDNRQTGDCAADADCTIGEARWRGHPTLERRTDGTVVIAGFENRSAQAPRIGRLTAYFRTSALRP
jgi:hypothetical protein